MQIRLRKFKTVRRFNNPGEAHMLTFTCYKNRAFLSRERTCTYLAEAIAQTRLKYNFHLWAYVFMPEHVHLLIWPTDDRTVSEIMKSMKQSVARRAVLYLRREKPEGLRLLATGEKGKPYRFWQDGGGHDRNLTDGHSVMVKVDYVHANPVRRGLVAYPEDWKWSSAREWMEPGSGPIPLDLDSIT